WHRVPGGTATSTVQVLAALDRRDDVELVGLAAWHRAAAALDVRPTIPVRHLPLPRRALYDTWHRFGRPSVQRFTGAVDIVHATGGVVPPAGQAALVVTIHDLAFLHRPGHFTRHGVRFLTRGFELTRRRADIVICPSRTTADDCAARGVEPDRLRVVPWGVEAGDVTPSGAETVRARLGLPSTFVLWVGTAEPRKNLRGLLAAIERATTDVPMVLVGPDGWGTDLEALIAATAHDVIRVGQLSSADLRALYSLARVFVYPSLLEGFGMPVLEAMAQGTPVITSSGTATEEVCGEAGRVVDPADLEAIAHEIDRMVADDDHRDQYAAAARERARGFPWAATAAGTAAVYRDALG
ncbi:MAG: glycosyltransferase family 4 protein, partial [Acidimicrobiales bacterium]